jgi:hypothetical protein
MGVFEMVVAIVFITTVGKVVASAARRRPAEIDTPRVAALEAQLRANELRLSQTEDRVAELGEKLVFVENLLDAPEQASRLAPPPSPR